MPPRWIRRLAKLVPDKRLPVTPDLLLKMYGGLRRIITNPTDQRMFWGSFKLAYHQFIRVSELTSLSHPHFRRDTTLLLDDRTIGKDQKSVTIKHSKSDQPDKGA